MRRKRRIHSQQNGNDTLELTHYPTRNSGFHHATKALDICLYRYLRSTGADHCANNKRLSLPKRLYSIFLYLDTDECNPTALMEWLSIAEAFSVSVDGESLTSEGDEGFNVVENRPARKAC